MPHPVPLQIYRDILEFAPNACVDVVIMHQDRVLMVYREREPAKHQWWFPGGRIYKNELLEDAIIRKAREEVGLDVRVVRKVGVYETLFPQAALPEVKSGAHTINIAFLAAPLTRQPEVVLDQDHSSFVWCASPAKDWNPYLKQVLKDLGWPPTKAGKKR
ncbi:MAG: NUDIX hydrolase [Candidatus Aenigmarchaeota archaeon]|nr:NUDIX hydrolase [Candidatus Aenigmarchaeota archaeon]